jgi:biofilm protein TabA
MIATDLDHLTGQIAMTPALQKAIDFLRQHRSGDQPLPDDKIAIDGERVVGSVYCYETVVTQAPKMEAHRKYIDLQFIVSGEEVIGWAPLDRMALTQPYDETKDACFGTVPPHEFTPVYLRAGQLAVLYPEDGHAPKMAAGKPVPVKKIIVKVAV